ncbi:hypothetical protein SAMN05421504_102633 [Amycolatopsis xylanica]|uniref:PH domain-containing protein n=1 Tax=Amycolatopsis xylanica TaxID=589385 RepID=A0A1H2ZR54_9PSEU|nr:hypothetical protein [Amycolatopsis xylanica]SDX19836.1 hypothetical protein SAMN05421504_102633 [Amycolatopsis xylanica]
MPLKAKIRNACKPFLPTGDEIRYLFPASSTDFGGERAVSSVGGVNFLVVVTDRRIVVIASSYWRRYKPSSVWEVYPRSTRLGPVDIHPSFGPTISFGGLALEIDEEYVSVIRAADLEVEGDLPADPLPDL